MNSPTPTKFKFTTDDQQCGTGVSPVFARSDVSWPGRPCHTSLLEHEALAAGVARIVDVKLFERRRAGIVFFGEIAARSGRTPKCTAAHTPRGESRLSGRRWSTAPRADALQLVSHVVRHVEARGRDVGRGAPADGQRDDAPVVGARARSGRGAATDPSGWRRYRKVQPRHRRVGVPDLEVPRLSAKAEVIAALRNRYGVFAFG